MFVALLEPSEGAVGHQGKTAEEEEEMREN